MRATALIIGAGFGVGLLATGFPFAAQSIASEKGARPEARIGSLAPDEMRRAERARRRAAERNAKTKTVARDTDRKITEGKSVAVSGKAEAPDATRRTAVMPPAPRKATADRRDAKPAPETAAREPATPRNAAPEKTAVAPPAPREALKEVAKGDGGVRDNGVDAAPRSRSAERRAKRYAARRKAHRERFASEGVYDQRASRDATLGDPRYAPSGAPPYPMRAREGDEVYVVRRAPPPYWGGYGPRPFYSFRGPGYGPGPVDDVE